MYYDCFGLIKFKAAAVHLLRERWYSTDIVDWIGRKHDVQQGVDVLDPAMVD